MRLVFLSSNEPNLSTTWSGTTRFIFRELTNRFSEVIYVRAQFDHLAARLDEFVGRASRKLSFNTVDVGLGLPRSILLPRLTGFELTQKINHLDPDVIFAAAVSAQMAYLRPKAPIAYTSDSTFASMRGYYPDFRKLSDFSARTANKLEEKSIANASLALYPSSWAAESASRDYGADPEKIVVCPYGANIEDPPPREQAMSSRLFDKCNLLFVGTDWNRKGGDFALSVLEILEARGIPAELNIVGSLPALRDRSSNLKAYGFLNKHKREDLNLLESLYKKSHFLVLPTRYEAYGIVFCEAAAYGIPVITFDTGGISSIVKNGETGFLMTLNSSPVEFADEIQASWSNPELYTAMQVAARDRYENTLNWTKWGECVEPLLRDLVNKAKPEGSQPMSPYAKHY